MASETSPLIGGNTPQSDTMGTGLVGIILRMVGPNQQLLAKFALLLLGVAIPLLLANSFDPRTVILTTFLLNGIVAVSFGFVMTLTRIMSTNVDGLVKTDAFVRLSRSQINNAEWNPMIMLLKFVIMSVAASKDIELTALASFAALWTDVSTVLYWLGVMVFYGELGNDTENMIGVRLPPFRFAGVASRYLGMYLMLYVVWTMM